MRYTINDLSYTGKYRQFFWDANYNPNATIENGLANCTTAVYGFCLVEGNPVPVSRIVSANQWHEYLINDWVEIPFEIDKVEVGDIIEWVDGCHVAKVGDVIDGKPFINGSYYTGEHGVSVYNSKYDARPFTSMETMCDFFIRNYPDRFYHYWSLEKESDMVGNEPTFILKHPKTVLPVADNSSVDQVETTDNTLRIRLEPNLNAKIVGHVSIGYYNVLSVKEATEEDKAREPELKCWYKIAADRWIANVTTIYHEAMDDPIEEIQRYFDGLKKTITHLSDENKNMKEDYMKIKNIIERWL